MVDKVNIGDFPPVDTKGLLRESLEMILKKEENPTIHEPVIFPDNTEESHDNEIVSE